MDVFNLFAEQEWDERTGPRRLPASRRRDRQATRRRVARREPVRAAAGRGARGRTTTSTGPEEWLLVVAGRPTLRTPEGERQLEPGDVVAFPQGPAGAHKVANATDETVRVVILSSKTADRGRRLSRQQEGRHLDEGGRLRRPRARRAEARLLGRRIDRREPPPHVARRADVHDLEVRMPRDPLRHVAAVTEVRLDRPDEQRVAREKRVAQGLSVLRVPELLTGANAPPGATPHARDADMQR